MHLNPYGADAVELAVSLATSPPETVAELAGACAEHQVRLPRKPRREDVDAVRTAIEEWVGVLDAPDLPTRAGRLNTMLADYTEHPRLTDHDDTWHLHYRSDDLAAGRVVAALIATGTALHLVGRGMHRIGRCGSQECGAPYADLSRNGTQRYCSTRCANREAVRRHRGA